MRFLKEHQSTWHCRPALSPLIHFVYQLYLTIILWLIPLMIMCILYALIIRSLKMDGLLPEPTTANDNDEQFDGMCDRNIKYIEIGNEGTA